MTDSETESIKSMTQKEKEQHFVDLFNQKQGNLNKDGFDCKKCLNKGQIAILFETSGHFHEGKTFCECVGIRKMIRNAKESGFGDLLEHKLKNFTVKKDWQKNLLSLAESYLASDLKCWFAVIGQSGAGKTMICSGICNQLLKRYKKVKYMSWVEFTETMKHLSFDDDKDEYFNGYANAEILYIDDLYKTSVSFDDFGKRKVNMTDVKYAFQLINQRYNKRLVTIISSELLLDELADVDEAIAGRIKERCEEYFFTIGRDSGRNFRFKG